MTARSSMTYDEAVAFRDVWPGSFRALAVREVTQ